MDCGYLPLSPNTDHTLAVLMLLLKLWMNLPTTVPPSAYDKKLTYFVHRHFHIVIIEEYAIYIDYKGNRLEKTGCNLRGITGLLRGSPGGSEVKASACNAGDVGSIPESERSPGEGNGNPLQYSCLENPMEGGA